MHHTRGSLPLLSTLLALLLAVGVTRAQSPQPGPAPGPARLAVVVHKDNPIASLGPGELRRIFLRQQVKWPNGWNITVLERPANSPESAWFRKLLLRRRQAALTEYWLNLKLTRGMKAPRVLKSTRLLALTMARTQGTISYLFEEQVDESMKVVALIAVPSHEAPGDDEPATNDDATQDHAADEDEDHD